MHSKLVFCEHYISESFHPPGDKHSSYSIALSDVLGLARSRENGCKYATYIREVEPSFKMEFDFDR